MIKSAKNAIKGEKTKQKRWPTDSGVKVSEIGSWDTLSKVYEVEVTKDRV